MRSWQKERWDLGGIEHRLFFSLISVLFLPSHALLHYRGLRVGELHFQTSTPSPFLLGSTNGSWRCETKWKRKRKMILLLLLFCCSWRQDNSGKRASGNLNAGPENISWKGAFRGLISIDQDNTFECWFHKYLKQHSRHKRASSNQWWERAQFLPPTLPHSLIFYVLFL